MKKRFGIIRIFLITGLLVSIIFAPCATAACDMPVVRSISGPNSREIANTLKSGGSEIQLSVQVNGGTPPYTYTWMNHISQTDFNFVNQDGIVYDPYEGNIVYTGTQYSTASFNMQNDFDTDERGHGWISVRITDSMGKRAIWEGDSSGMGGDLFVWGIELWNEDYSITDEVERAAAAIHVYPVPPTSCSGQTEETPGVIPGTLIPVKSCFDAGTRCYGGPDCINGICVDPCQGSSSPFCQCNCIVTPPEDNSWIVIVGGLVVVAVAAVAIIARRLKNRPKKKGEQPPEQYILQLSKDTLKVSPKQSDSFTVTAWKVTEEGGLVPVPTAQITVTPPRNIPALLIQPAAGSGSLTPAVSLRIFPGSITGVITIIASAGGRTVSADVKVTVEGEADIEFD
jgi:hypothetical protein